MNTLVSIKLEKLLLEKGIDMPVQPRISDVVMWLYKKHGIWIGVDTDINGKFRYTLRKHYITNKLWIAENPTSISEYFSEPIPAYEAAIDYCLNHIV